MVTSTHDRMKLAVLTILLMLVLWLPCATASEEFENILDIRTAIIESGAEWDASVTSVSGLTESEKAQLGLGADVPKPSGGITSAPSMRTVQYEERFDWRDLDMVTPVKHQGSCGSCWAFSAVGVIESKFLIDAGGKELDLSEQHLVSGCCNAGNCDGGWPDWGFDYAQEPGIPIESCCPYVARDTSCDSCDGWKDSTYKIVDHVYVEPSIEDFKWALKEYGPLAVVLNAPSDWYYYRSGVYSPVTDVGWANHAVILSGWDDADGCWFIKNSWGAGWGEGGYARVKYGDLERYNYAYAVTGIMDHGDAPAPTGWVTPVSAVASTEHSEKYSALKAVDNNTATHWFSKYREETPSITFDLGRVQTINTVRAIIHYKDIPMQVDIETSEDGETWQMIVECFEIRDAGEYVAIPFTASICRYVRMCMNGPRYYGTCTAFDVWVHAPNPKPPADETILTIKYMDHIEVIPLDHDLIGIVLSQNETKVFEWWS